MSAVRYADLRHDCVLPDMSHLPRYGDPRQVMARWRCPECDVRWRYAASFLAHDRMYWERAPGSRPSRRWRKAEEKRIAALEVES